MTQAHDPGTPRVKRCAWCDTDDTMRAYHDEEWGVPEYDGRALWEKLILDGFQAGLSWRTILLRREGFRRAFKGFDPVKIAAFTAKDVERLMGDAGIIRSRSKIEATIGNARAYLAMQAAGQDFSKFCWSFVNGKPVQTRGPRPTQTEASVAMSKALKKLGFKFVGPVIVYAWMQATGLVNDHENTCFRRREVAP
ncbi:DNA-3-methyladenine glycosylase I [Luteibacter sp. Sphag1AF]|uniref:DNA-3-methyladenine glycosylase I n=1 Tax=Luteibacter sp. Sphag1AF TaxID=2587031 RepID=UPI00161053CF|nr:DNA-3-methyladenine glycosylase I [Luteibacter sp. Sphag1AF]MBB3226168.1 DNA-3-methyladenine glycosylase I [Luteibacter sp. Sphag1AF]